MNIALEKNFEIKMVEVYRNAMKEVNYPAKIFLGMVGEFSGVETAKKLLSKKDDTTGFVALAYEKKRPDLTMEHLIYYNEDYHSLFTNEEIAICKERLIIKN